MFYASKTGFRWSYDCLFVRRKKYVNKPIQSDAISFASFYIPDYIHESRNVSCKPVKEF
jgi:hypothetical protein